MRKFAHVLGSSTRSCGTFCSETQITWRQKRNTRKVSHPPSTAVKCAKAPVGTDCKHRKFGLDRVIPLTVHVFCISGMMCEPAFPNLRRNHPVLCLSRARVPVNTETTCESLKNEIKWFNSAPQYIYALNLSPAQDKNAFWVREHNKTNPTFLEFALCCVFFRK